jgi:single-strand DNA-binding protein
MINNFVGVGRLTGDAELKYLGNGTAKTAFSFCINKSYMKGGEWQNKANFFRCIIWGKYGESMHKHLTKGRQIGIVGELDQNTWTDNSGVKHNEINIIVNSISLMARPKNGGDTGGHETSQERGQSGSSDLPDEPPF